MWPEVGSIFCFHPQMALQSHRWFMCTVLGHLNERPLRKEEMNHFLYIVSHSGRTQFRWVTAFMLIYRNTFQQLAHSTSPLIISQSACMLLRRRHFFCLFFIGSTFIHGSRQINKENEGMYTYCLSTYI